MNSMPDLSEVAWVVLNQLAHKKHPPILNDGESGNGVKACRELEAAGLVVIQSGWTLGSIRKVTATKLGRQVVVLWRQGQAEKLAALFSSPPKETSQ